MSRNKILATIFFVFLFLLVAASYFGYYHHIHQYDAMIVRIASRYDLDPVLIRSVIYEESYFKKDARSSAGAIGLMQVTPIIVKEWTRVTSQEDLNKAFPNPSEERKSKKKRPTEAELLAYPEINLQLGCWYLDQLMKRYNEVEDPLPIVLASYNAGPSNAQRWQQLAYQATKKTVRNNYRERYIRQIDFPETKRYVSSILTRYKNGNQDLGQTDRVSSTFNQD